MFFGYFLALLDWWKTGVRLRGRKSKPLFKEGEVWWTSIGLNIGVEIFGKGDQFARPVLIFKKFNADSFLGIPLTSRLKDELWYIPLRCVDREARAVLSQTRCFDAKRLMKRMVALTDEQFVAIKQMFLDRYGS